MFEGNSASCPSLLSASLLLLAGASSFMLLLWLLALAGLSFAFLALSAFAPSPTLLEGSSALAFPFALRGTAD